MISEQLQMPCAEDAIKGTFFCQGHTVAEWKWHWLVMEGEVETHEDCKGPDCDCWKGAASKSS